MKKFLTSVFLILTTFIFASCSTSTVYVVDLKAKWHDNLLISYVAEIDESLEYNVTFEPAALQTKIQLKNFSGTYMVNVKNQTQDEQPYYLLTTTLQTSGEYQKDEQVLEIADEVTTQAAFLGTAKTLAPLFSHKTYNGYGFSPFGATLAERFKKYNYAYDITYQQNNATVNFTTALDKIASKQQYNKLNKKVPYFDNEQLLFALRAFDFKESFSQSVWTVNAISQELQRIYISTTDKPYDTITLKDFSQNSQTADFDVGVIKVSVALGSKMSGSPVICYYAAEKGQQNTFNSRLIKMEVAMPDSMGTLVYTLSAVK